MLTSPFLVTASVLLVSAAGLAALYFGLYSDSGHLEERLNDLAIKVRMQDPSFEETDLQEEGFGRILLQWAQRRLPAAKKVDEKLVNTLAHAGFHGAGAVVIFQLARFLCMAVGGLLGFAIFTLMGSPTGARLMFTIAGLIVGYLLPTFYVTRRASWRQVKISRELSDVLDLLVVTIESGLGIFEAIKVVGRETERQGRELGSELTMLSGEISTGSSLGQGLRALAERTGVDDVRSLAAILIQSEKLGSQMGPALRASAESLRTRRRLRAEEAAQKSAVKMLIPLVFFVLPAMMAVILGPAVVHIVETFKR